MRSISRKWFKIILASLTVSGCAGQEKVDVPNFPFYGDKGKYGATKVESLHPEKPGVRLPKSEWDTLRIGMVCTDAANIRTIQTLIDTLCTKNSFACNYVSDGVAAVKSTLSAAQKAVE